MRALVVLDRKVEKFFGFATVETSLDANPIRTVLQILKGICQIEPREPSSRFLERVDDISRQAQGDSGLQDVDFANIISVIFKAAIEEDEGTFFEKMIALDRWLNIFNADKLDGEEHSRVTPVQIMASFYHEKLLPDIVMPAVFPDEPQPVVDTLESILLQPSVNETNMRVHLLNHASAMLALVRKCELSTKGLTMFLQSHIDELPHEEDRSRFQSLLQHTTEEEQQLQAMLDQVPGLEAQGETLRVALQAQDAQLGEQHGALRAAFQTRDRQLRDLDQLQAQHATIQEQNQEMQRRQQELLQYHQESQTQRGQEIRTLSARHRTSEEEKQRLGLRHAELARRHDELVQHQKANRIIMQLLVVFSFGLSVGLVMLHNRLQEAQLQHAPPPSLWDHFKSWLTPYLPSSSTPITDLVGWNRAETMLLQLKEARHPADTPFRGLTDQELTDEEDVTITGATTWEERDEALRAGAIPLDSESEGENDESESALESMKDESAQRKRPRTDDFENMKARCAEIQRMGVIHAQNAGTLIQDNLMNDACTALDKAMKSLTKAKELAAEMKRIQGDDAPKAMASARKLSAKAFAAAAEKGRIHRFSDHVAYRTPYSSTDEPRSAGQGGNGTSNRPKGGPR